MIPWRWPSPSVHLRDRVEAIDAYVAAADLPSLTDEEVALLSQPITIEELASASAGSPKGKAPGPGGFTISYYKTFQARLATHFVTAFNAILDNHIMPLDLLQTSITLSPKPEKDPLLCASYRLISLLNCDLKLFTKILAETRLCPPRYSPLRSGRIYTQ